MFKWEAVPTKATMNGVYIVNCFDLGEDGKRMFFLKRGPVVRCNFGKKQFPSGSFHSCHGEIYRSITSSRISFKGFVKGFGNIYQASHFSMCMWLSLNRM